METFSALLAICAGNSPVPGEFPTQRPVTRSFDVFFDLRLNKRLSKQSWGWWFETLSYCNDSCGCRGYDRYDEAFPLGSLSVNPCMKISQINFVWEGLMESWTNDWIVSKRQFTYLKSTVYLRIFENVVAPIFWWLQLRHNERDGVSNHRRLNGLLKRLFRRRSTKTSKLRVIGLWEWNSPVTGNFPSQRASNAEKFQFDEVIMWPAIVFLTKKSAQYVGYFLIKNTPKIHANAIV